MSFGSCDQCTVAAAAAEQVMGMHLRPFPAAAAAAAAAVCNTSNATTIVTLVNHQLAVVGCNVL